MPFLFVILLLLKSCSGNPLSVDSEGERTLLVTPSVINLKVAADPGTWNTEQVVVLVMDKDKAPINNYTAPVRFESDNPNVMISVNNSAPETNNISGLSDSVSLLVYTKTGEADEYEATVNISTGGLISKIKVAVTRSDFSITLSPETISYVTQLDDEGSWRTMDVFVSALDGEGNSVDSTADVIVQSVDSANIKVPEKVSTNTSFTLVFFTKDRLAYQADILFVIGQKTGKLKLAVSSPSVSASHKISILPGDITYTVIPPDEGSWHNIDILITVSDESGNFITTDAVVNLVSPLSHVLLSPDYIETEPPFTVTIPDGKYTLPISFYTSSDSEYSAVLSISTSYSTQSISINVKPK